MALKTMKPKKNKSRILGKKHEIKESDSLTKRLKKKK